MPTIESGETSRPASAGPFNVLCPCKLGAHSYVARSLTDFSRVPRACPARDRSIDRWSARRVRHFRQGLRSVIDTNVHRRESAENAEKRIDAEPRRHGAAMPVPRMRGLDRASQRAQAVSQSRTACARGVALSCWPAEIGRPHRHGASCVLRVFVAPCRSASSVPSVPSVNSQRTLMSLAFPHSSTRMSRPREVRRGRSCGNRQDRELD